jgi:formamidopyrimidine-DNA glycosylase
MPELPEVETTLRGIKPHLEGQPLTAVEVRVVKLRNIIPPELPRVLVGRALVNLRRRNKYILAEVAGTPHTLLVHLGMSGRFCIGAVALGELVNVPGSPNPKHDHVVLRTDKTELRYNDPRKFGMFDVLPTTALTTHPLLAKLGPEPLTDAFDGAVLYTTLRSCSTAIKPTIMDATVVCGVGNIYASESLFRAGIKPQRRADKLSKAEAHSLAMCIKEVLAAAIAAGGSSLRDYAQPDGQVGYFFNAFNVYGRTGKPCNACGTPIAHTVQAQRSTFWCPTCQPR